MQQVLITIENKEIENRLLDEAVRYGRQPGDIIIEFLEKNFLRKRAFKKPGFRKLDPLKHMMKVNVKMDDKDDLIDVSPFKEVTDSAAYARELRKNAWRK